MVTTNSAATRDAPARAAPKPPPDSCDTGPQPLHTETAPDTLAIAQQDLAGVADDAQEEGYPIPSDLAFDNARRLLPAICQLTPRPVAVYAAPYDGIVIDISGGFGRSVGLHCESDGGALCMVNLDGEHRRARYDNTRTLPDGFLREALAEVETKPRE